MAGRETGGIVYRMTSAEGRPKGRKGPEGTDRVIAETGEKLHEMFRDAQHGADIEESRTYNQPDEEKEYPSTPNTNEVAFWEAWKAKELLGENANEEALRKALMFLDTAIAIHNEPKYQIMRQSVLRRLSDRGGV